MKKIILTSIIAILINLTSTAQDCLVQGMVKEVFGNDGKPKKKYTYTFTYNGKGILEKVNATSTDGYTSQVTFSKLGSGVKIVLSSDGEYDYHLINKGNEWLEFESDDENDLNPENASYIYPLTYENGKLTKIEYSKEIKKLYSWKGDLIDQYISTGRNNYLATTTFTYADTPNPFHSLQLLGSVQISFDDYIPYLFTLPSKLILSEKTTLTRNGVEGTYDDDRTYNHKVDSNGCVEQLTVEEKKEKTVYTFTY